MSRIIHGGVCVNAIDKPLEWAVRFFFANTVLSLEQRSLYILITACQDDIYRYTDTYCHLNREYISISPMRLIAAPLGLLLARFDRPQVPMGERHRHR